MTSQIVKNRLKAFQVQSGRCYYCGSMMWLDNKEDFAAKHKIGILAAERLKCTAEHLTARCDGGKSNRSNIVAACLLCNSERHRLNKAPEPNQYKELIQQQLKKGKWHPKSLRHLVSRPA